MNSRVFQELEELKEEFERMKRAVAANTEAGEDSARLQALQKEAESLMTDTNDIMQALKGSIHYTPIP